MSADNKFVDEVVQFFQEKNLDIGDVKNIQPGKSIIPLKGARLTIICSQLHSESINKENIPTDSYIQIWEDIWLHQREKVTSMLSAQAGLSNRIYARDTIVRQLDTVIANNFLDQNHIMGTTSAHLKFGLYKRTELLAIMTFSKPRPMPKKGIDYTSVEIIRFCNKLNHTVVGGISKLIQHYLKLNRPTDFMTSCDLDWADGAGFRNIGFEPSVVTTPLSFEVDSKGKRSICAHDNSPKQIINQGNQRFILLTDKLTSS